MDERDIDGELKELERAASKPELSGSGKMLRWAIVWLGVCGGGAAVLGLVVGNRMPAESKAPTLAVATHATTTRNAARPSAQSNAIASVYRADGNGHFLIDGVVNGTPVRFLLDTGASFVSLTPDDARAVGLMPSDLHFDGHAQTANGVARVAPVTLREIRLGQLSQMDVPALVMEKPGNVSLLGMSFLKRLPGYDIRDGQLTIYW